MQINVKLSPDVLDWVMAHIQQENVPRDVVKYLTTVSYTHLDVYKRQGLCNATRRFCAETSAMLEQGLGKALPNKWQTM